MWEIMRLTVEEVGFNYYYGCQMSKYSQSGIEKQNENGLTTG